MVLCLGVDVMRQRHLSPPITVAPDQAEQLHRPLRATSGVDPIVELLMKCQVPDAIGGKDPPHLSLQPLERGDQLVVDVRKRELHRCTLEDEAQVVHVDRLVQ